MASGLRLLIDNTPTIGSIRRNLLLATSLGFVLAFARADASDFKFLEVRIPQDALFGCVFGIAMYYLVVFAFRLAMVVVAWRIDANKTSAQEEHDLRLLAENQSGSIVDAYLERHRTADAIEKGPYARALSVVSIVLEFVAPAVFAALVLIALAQKFSLSSFFG